MVAPFAAPRPPESEGVAPDGVDGRLAAAAGSESRFDTKVSGTVTRRAVVLRNDAFLFGALRKAFVCKVSDAGLTDCNSSTNP